MNVFNADEENSNRKPKRIDHRGADDDTSYSMCPPLATAADDRIDNNVIYTLYRNDRSVQTFKKKKINKYIRYTGVNVH